jgi:valyl-tRNA synthetase
MRMMFSGIEQTGQVPFDTVLIHGLVRDEQGRKMSKSLGNGVDPLEIIDNFGADALRFSLITGNSPGNDMRYIPSRVESCRNFANKIWNAARFLLMNLESDKEMALPEKLALEDKWILSKYNKLVKDVTENIDKYELGLAAQKLYDFIWDVYCDWYIEICKARLNGEDKTAADNARSVLVFVLSNTLKLLHPFMPYITEEIWQSLPHSGESIMVSQWPTYSDALAFSKDEEDFEKIMDAIKAIRNRRSEMNVPPSRKAKVCVATAFKDVFSAGESFFIRLASASEVEIGESFDIPGAVRVVTDAANIFIPMNELVDKEKELARLDKERAKVQKDIDFLSGKLNNQGFIAKAPEKLIEAEKAKLAAAEEKMAKIMQSIEAYKA